MSCTLQKEPYLSEKSRSMVMMERWAVSVIGARVGRGRGERRRRFLSVWLAHAILRCPTQWQTRAAELHQNARLLVQCQERVFVGVQLFSWYFSHCDGKCIVPPGREMPRAVAALLPTNNRAPPCPALPNYEDRS